MEHTVHFELHVRPGDALPSLRRWAATGVNALATTLSLQVTHGSMVSEQWVQFADSSPKETYPANSPLRKTA